MAMLKQPDGNFKMENSPNRSKQLVFCYFCTGWCENGKISFFCFKAFFRILYIEGPCLTISWNSLRVWGSSMRSLLIELLIFKALTSYPFHSLGSFAGNPIFFNGWFGGTTHFTKPIWGLCGGGSSTAAWLDQLEGNHDMFRFPEVANKNTYDVSTWCRVVQEMCGLSHTHILYYYIICICVYIIYIYI